MRAKDAKRKRAERKQTTGEQRAHDATRKRAARKHTTDEQRAHNASLRRAARRRAGINDVDDAIVQRRRARDRKRAQRSVQTDAQRTIAIGEELGARWARSLGLEWDISAMGAVNCVSDHLVMLRAALDMHQDKMCGASTRAELESHVQRCEQLRLKQNQRRRRMCHLRREQKQRLRLQTPTPNIVFHLRFHNDPSLLVGRHKANFKAQVRQYIVDKSTTLCARPPEDLKIKRGYTTPFKHMDPVQFRRRSPLIPFGIRDQDIKGVRLIHAESHAATENYVARGYVKSRDPLPSSCLGRIVVRITLFKKFGANGTFDSFMFQGSECCTIGLCAMAQRLANDIRSDGHTSNDRMNKDVEINMDPYGIDTFTMPFKIPFTIDSTEYILNRDVQYHHPAVKTHDGPFMFPRASNGGLN